LLRAYNITEKKFNYLAVYDLENKYGADIPDVEKERKWKSFYRKRINRIKRGKATFIPGFKNLREFSANPVIKKYLKKKRLKSGGIMLLGLVVSHFFLKVSINLRRRL
jgi:hypothetical protein